MALRVEMRFIYESDFVNKRKGFIVKDNPDWEIDSSTSLDLADSLDDISDFEAELKSADSDSVSEISSSSATNDDSDLYGEGASATKKKTVKERNLQRKLNRGVEMIVARNNQSCQPSSQDSEVDVELTRTLMHQSIPAAPIPPPGQLRGICTHRQSRGSGISLPKGYPRAFDTRGF